MIHLYCGDGKGKTTAAMGLALRTAGRNGAVVIAQFLKGGDSGERYALARVPQVTLLPVQAVLSALDTLSCEIVLTGRDPHPELARRADYITCCQKIRHPFDDGQPARPGVEF